MKFTVLTLFPQLIEPFFNFSIMKKAIEQNLVSFELVNIRDFASPPRMQCDDIPYGGGAGMVLKPEPISKALDSVGAKEKKVVYLTPSGERYSQKDAFRLSNERELVIICGRYEGLDQRIIDLYVDEELCIGDYVISSGEVASLVLIDSIYRLIPGVLSSRSLEEETFSNERALLEYPHYTRPYVFNGLKVPDVLLSGHHEKIKAWRCSKSLEKTKKNRLDLYIKYQKLRGDEL